MKKLMPFITKLEPGSYYWCTCGETKSNLSVMALM